MVHNGLLGLSKGLNLLPHGRDELLFWLLGHAVPPFRLLDCPPAGLDLKLVEYFAFASTMPRRQVVGPIKLHRIVVVKFSLQTIREVFR